MKTKVFSQDGSEVRTIDLPEALFGVAWNADLVHDVVVGLQANERANSAHTKDRSEVRGGGKKPWKQKGTGRARHGSRRSPIWVGGGIAHGPRSERDYTVKLNRKMKAKALVTVLSRKVADNEFIALEDITLAAPKTALMKTMFGAVAKSAAVPDLVTKRTNAALVVLPARNEVVELSLRNLGQVAVVQAKDLNPLDLLTYKYVIAVAPDTTFATLEKRVKSTAVTA